MEWLHHGPKALCPVNQLSVLNSAICWSNTGFYRFDWLSLEFSSRHKKDYNGLLFLFVIVLKHPFTKQFSHLFCSLCNTVTTLKWRPAGGQLHQIDERILHLLCKLPAAAAAKIVVPVFVCVCVKGCACACVLMGVSVWAVGGLGQKSKSVKSKIHESAARQLKVRKSERESVGG